MGEIAEYIYQSMVSGHDDYILRVMDISDDGWKETLEESGLLDIHDDLKELVRRER